MLGLNRPFLKWWVQFVCSIFAIVVFFELGWLHALYNADITKISMLILTVFISTQILIGYMSKYTQVVKTRRLANYAWFSSEAMITMGMIGTVAGSASCPRTIGAFNLRRWNRFSRSSSSCTKCWRR